MNDFFARLFGEEPQKNTASEKAAATHKVLELQVPPRQVFNQGVSEYSFSTKDELWRNISSLLNILSDYSIVWQGSDVDLLLRAENVTKTIQTKKYSSIKATLTDFYTLITYPKNLEIITGISKEPRNDEVAQLLIKNGAVTPFEIADIFKWAYKKGLKSYDCMTAASDLLYRWQQLPGSLVLKSLTKVVTGPSYTTNTGYWYPRYKYLVPEAGLIAQVLSKQSAIKTFALSKETEKKLTFFSGTDFIPFADTILNLINSKTIVPVKTKVGKNAVKRLAALVPLKQFPKKLLPDQTEMSRTSIVASLCFLATGFLGYIKPSDKDLDSYQSFLKTILKTISPNFELILKEFLTPEIEYSGLEYFCYSRRAALGNLTPMICGILKDSCPNNDEQWLEYNSLSMAIDMAMACRGFDYICPTKSKENPECVLDMSHHSIPMTQFKHLFHDNIKRKVFIYMAAVGIVDLMVSAGGEIKYLKLSDAGRWYLGLSDELKVDGMKTINDYISIDSESAMVLIHETDFPFMTLLNEVAEKVTDTRYFISEKSLVSGCVTEEDFKQKLKRLESLLDGKKPSGKILSTIQSIKAKTGLTKLAPSGTQYALYTIDPKNSELHKLILSNPEIRENTLRVEGSRLLVRNTFRERFAKILAQAGYLN